MRIAVFGNTYQERYIDGIDRLFKILSRRNVCIEMEASFYEYLCHILPEPPHINETIKNHRFEAALAMSIGGDGTFLHTAQWIGDKEIPILGINTGHLGYLADASIENIESSIDDIFMGHYRIEPRTMIEATSPDWGEPHPRYALNEVAIMKNDTSSMVDMDALIDGVKVANYRADGLIISTPTGSTGYNLSVGGPIVAPLAPVWIISPIAAHSLTMRPLVVSDTSTLSVTTRSRSESYRIRLDGRPFSMEEGTTVVMRRAPFVTKVVQRSDHQFIETLRSKLLWGVDKR